MMATTASTSFTVGGGR